VEAVALAPVVFEPGTARLGPAMTAHLERVTDFLRGAPSVNLVLAPILTQADVDALKREQVRARLAGADPLATAQREYRERWPERPLPADLEAIIAALAAAVATAVEAMRALATRRLDVVRDGLTRGGGVDAGRLTGTARRTPLVEAGGAARVELDPRS
jgi:hypothetical protein